MHSVEKQMQSVDGLLSKINHLKPNTPIFHGFSVQRGRLSPKIAYGGPFPLSF